MPKLRKFNIDNFVADAEDSVIVAAEQKKKEKLEEAKNILAQNIVENADPAQINLMAAQALQQSAMTMQQPIPGMPQQVTPFIQQPEMMQKGKRGRKKSLRTIERVNGKIVFLEKETDANLSRISTLERFDKQDIIRTALHEWLEKHYDGMMLDQEGRVEILNYIQRTTTFEEY